MSDAAKVRSEPLEAFDQNNPQLPEDWDMRAHIGIDPMLLALSMELALKAWLVFDHDTAEVKKSHSLLKLFDGLKQDSRQKLDTEFRRSIAPRHPNALYVDYGIRNALSQHENAFVDWRYTHEDKSVSFHVSTFKATLEMVLIEFKKRYRTVEVSPFGLLR